MAFGSCGHVFNLFKVGLLKVSQFFFPFVLESPSVVKAVCRAFACLTLLCPARRSLPDGGVRLSSFVIVSEKEYASLCPFAMPTLTPGVGTCTEQLPLGKLLVSPRPQLDFLSSSQASIYGFGDPGAVLLQSCSEHRPLIADFRLKSPLKLPSKMFFRKGWALFDDAAAGHMFREFSASAVLAWVSRSLVQGVEEGRASANESAVKEFMLNTARYPVALRKRLDQQKDPKEFAQLKPEVTVATDPEVKKKKFRDRKWAAWMKASDAAVVLAAAFSFKQTSVHKPLWMGLGGKLTADHHEWVQRALLHLSGKSST